MLTYKRVLLCVFIIAFAFEAIAATRWALETTIGLGSSQTAEALALRGAATAINAALIYAVLVFAVGIWRRWGERRTGAPHSAAQSTAGADRAGMETPLEEPGAARRAGGSNGYRR